MSRARLGLLVVLAAACLYLPPLGQRVIQSSDEARFPLLARDMLARDLWYGAEVRDRTYRNKPPLYPWAIKVLSLPGGRVTEATAQAPVALAGVLAVLFTFLLGDRLFGRRAGLGAALIVVTAYDFFGHTQKLLPDMIVVAFATGALYAFWRSVAEPGRPDLRVAFWVALALAVFAKGPMGLLPLVAAGAWLLTERGVRGLAHLGSLAGLAAFAAITLAWVAPYLALGPATFVTGVLESNWLGWYLGGPSLEGLADVAVDLLEGFLPWTIVAAAALGAIPSAWREPAPRFALLSLVVPLGVIALSSNQRTRYLLPLYPAAALLVAWWVERHTAAPGRLGRALGWLGLAGGAAGVIAVARAPWSGQPEFLAGHTLGWIPLAAGLAVTAGALWAGLSRGRSDRLIPGAALGAALVLVAGVWPYTEWVNRTQDFRGLAERLAHHAGPGETRVFGGRFFQLDFYLGRELDRIWTVEEFNAFVTRPERPVALVNGRTWGLIQEQIPPGIVPLETHRVRGQDMLIVRYQGR